MLVAPRSPGPKEGLSGPDTWLGASDEWSCVPPSPQAPPFLAPFTFPVCGKQGDTRRTNQDSSATRLVFLSVAGRGALPAGASNPSVAIGIPQPQITMTNSHRFRQQLQGPLRGVRLETLQAAP